MLADDDDIHLPGLPPSHARLFEDSRLADFGDAPTETLTTHNITIISKVKQSQ